MSREEIEQLAQRLLATVEEPPRPIHDDDEGERIDAVALAARRVQQVLARTPWTAIPPSWLDGVVAAYEPVAAAVESFASAGDPDVPIAFPVTWDQISAMWASLTPFLSAMLPEESVSEDAVSFRRSAGQLLRRLGDEVEAARAETGRVRSELAEVEVERDAALQTIREQQATLEATITQQTARLEEAIRQNQAQFSASQEQHRQQVADLLTEQRAALDSAVGDAGSRTADAVESAEARATEALGRIAALEAKAVQSYKTIGDAAVAGHYQRDANQQAWQANFWRAVAVVVFLLVGVGTIVELATSGGTLAWAETRSRIPVVIGLGALAAFAVAEARIHRKAERASRRREVELSSLDPFLALIDDDRAAERVKIDYARRVFVEQSADDLPTEPEPGTA